MSKIFQFKDRQKLVTPAHIAQKRVKVELVILRSIDGEQDWEPVLPNDVPAFVRRSDIVRRMVEGEMVQLESQSPYWFRAEQISTDQVIH